MTSPFRAIPSGSPDHGCEHHHCGAPGPLPENKLIQPEIGDHFSGDIIDQPGIGIPGIGVGLDLQSDPEIYSLIASEQSTSVPP